MFKRGRRRRAKQNTRPNRSGEHRNQRHDNYKFEQREATPVGSAPPAELRWCRSKNQKKDLDCP
jgi:hypothetical protein